MIFTLDASTRHVDFAERLRTGTLDTHRAAERAPLMRDLLAGRLPLAQYAALLVQLRSVYARLEAASTVMRNDPVAGLFVSDRLRRLDKIDADITHIVHRLGPDASELPGLLPATVTYCRRIEVVSGTWSGGFVAHHYTRYLGDLSGGEILRRRLAAAYGLDGAGLSFYDFAEIDDPAAFKDEYRRKLNDAPWDAHEQERIVDEVIAAYRFNQAVFDEVVGWSA
jgi:heme oxygenase